MKSSHITKKFGGILALDDVSVEFRSGQITSLLGSNGSGKSTFIDVLSGAIKPDRGTVCISVETKVGESPFITNTGNSIVRTFQHGRLFEQMTVMDNILVVLTKRNVLGALFEVSTLPYDERAEYILQKVGLWGVRDVLAEDLSYGQHKLLSFGRVIAVDADIYMFDEPLSGLFQKKLLLIEELLRELRAEGKIIILVDHNIHFISKVSDHLVVLESGRVIAQGGVEILDHKEVVESYIGT